MSISQVIKIYIELMAMAHKEILIIVMATLVDLEGRARGDYNEIYKVKYIMK